MLRRIYILIMVSALFSCKQVQQLTDVFVPPSPREEYARNFEKDHLVYAQWGESFRAALADSLQINLPYSEAGNFLSRDFPVYSYSTFLSRGEKLLIAFSTRTDSIPVFIDIFKHHSADSLTQEPILAEKRYGRLPVEFAVGESGNYKLVLQPEMRQEGEFQLEIYTQPTLPFPVAGMTNKAIQSFWGAPRSAGTRTHEGIDIFASKGTPVLAVVDGGIGFAGERGLGGKQVWLREGFMKKSFYYAHLDSIKVSSSNKVSLGDTLGFVGNTGNARTTSPHLHFGIYTGNGAIDPLPFIRRQERLTAELPPPAIQGRIASQKANVRLGPNVQSELITSLGFRDTIAIMGRTKDWYHVKIGTRTRGFIHHSLIREMGQSASTEIGASSR